VYHSDVAARNAATWIEVAGASSYDQKNQDQELAQSTHGTKNRFSEEKASEMLLFLYKIFA
jgi:hypothetical protein